MGQTMVTPSLDIGYIDKRRLALPTSQLGNATRVGITIFTCNATGTTTTAKGADAVPATADTNVVRRGEDFKLFNSSGVAKEETVFRITGVASAAGTTTLTFTPAAAVAPVSGDILKRVGPDQFDDVSDLDFALNAFSGTTYPQSVLDTMTINDKVYALRNIQDAGSLP